MGELLLRLFIKLEIASRNAERLDPLLKLVDPLLVDTLSVVRCDKILHLHLLEFTRSEDEITRRNFVAKCLADLRNAEGQLSTRGVQYICEIDKNPLRGLGT